MLLSNPPGCRMKFGQGTLCSLNSTGSLTQSPYQRSNFHIKIHKITLSCSLISKQCHFLSTILIIYSRHRLSTQTISSFDWSYIFCPVFLLETFIALWSRKSTQIANGIVCYLQREMRWLVSSQITIDVPHLTIRAQFFFEMFVNSSQ